LRRLESPKWLALLALTLCIAGAVGIAKAQTYFSVTVRGYLCGQVRDAEALQNLAATSEMTRTEALWKFNRTYAEPRCSWYDRINLIYKGPLKQRDLDVKFKPRYLFAGGDGGVFEILVYETQDGDETYYSWRRTRKDSDAL